MTTFKLRRGTAAAWTAANPTLALGEPGIETDTLKWKVGDGSTAWNSLAYFNPGSASFATPSIALGSSAAAGAASTVIRSDATIAAFDATSPSTQAFGDAAAVGTAAFAARRDHKHAMPADPFTGATAGGDLNGTYPNPSVDAELFGPLPWTVVTKPSDTGRNSTTSPTADPHLVATLTSGAVYEIFAIIIYKSAAGAGTPDIKVGFGEDSTARGLVAGMHAYTTTEGPTTLGPQNYAAPGVAFTGSFGTDTAIRPLFLRGWYVGNGASAGVWWSQATSNGNDTTVLTNSRLCYRRIDT